MPSFDIVNKIDFQELDNALNNARKEIVNRYDFRGAKVEINFDKKEKKINLVAPDEMKMEAVREIVTEKAAKRNVDPKALKFGDPLPTMHAAIKREVKIVEGLEQDISKQIVKMIKDAKFKVQASIQGDQVRVTGKQIDDLQAVMAMLREAKLGVPLQFVNMQR